MTTVISNNASTDDEFAIVTTITDNVFPITVPLLAKGNDLNY